MDDGLNWYLDYIRDQLVTNKSNRFSGGMTFTFHCKDGHVGNITTEYKEYVKFKGVRRDRVLGDC